MADDWVKRYTEKQKGKSKKRDSELKTQELAEESAPSLFKSLAKRVEQDVKCYADDQLQCWFTPSNTVVVTKTHYPAVELTVTLNRTVIEYTCWFQESADGERRDTSGEFRVLSNASRSAQVFKNGEPYTDVSEVSEVLLIPVFTYIDTSR